MLSISRAVFATRTSSKLLVTASALAFALSAQVVCAQSGLPPVHPYVDGNGVDLQTGTFNINTTDVSIGSGSTGIAFQRQSWGYGGLPQSNFSATLTPSGSTMYVSIGNVSDVFSISGTTYTPKQANGASLTQSGTTFTYTAHDGTVVTFVQNATGSALISLYYANPTKIVTPSGAAYNLNWETASYCVTQIGIKCTLKENIQRLDSVTNSSGYALTFSHEMDAPIASASDAKSYGNVTAISNGAAQVQYSQTPNGSSSNYNVTDPLGHTTVYTSSSGKLTIATPAGASATVSYSQAAPYGVSSVVNGSGTTTYGYVPSGSTQTTTVTDTLGHATKYTFDVPSQTLRSVTDALSNATSFAVDSYGRVTQVTKPEGNAVQTVYDARGNVTQQTAVAKAGSGLANIVTKAGYDATCTNAVKCNQPNWTLDAFGKETDFTYDPTSGLLTSVTGPADPNGVRPQTRYSYTLTNGVQLLSGSSSCRTQAGASISGTAGVGPFTISGPAACAGTADETKTTIVYDSQMRPLSQTVAAGDGSVSSTSSQTYDNIGNVATTTGPLGTGQTTYKFYDANRRLTGTIAPDPDGAGSRTPAAVQYSYNADGVLTQTSVGTVPNQATAMGGFAEYFHTANTLDSYDRPVRVTKVSNGTTYAVSDQLYDSLGRGYCSVQYMNLSAVPGSVSTSCAPSQTTGPNGPDRIVQNSYDANNRVLSTSDGVGVLKTVAGYNPNGTVTAVIDGTNNRTTYTYDGFDRPSKTNYPVATQGGNASDANNYESLSYDAGGHVLQKLLRGGGTISSTYDNLGRASSVTRSDNSTVNYTYDLAGRPLTMSRTNDGSALSYTYDGLGRLTKETQPYGAMSYQYNAAGAVTRLTWADNFYVNYVYDMIGGVTAIQENGATSGVGLLASYNYDNLGRRTSVAYGNGTSRIYGYDAVSRLAGLQLTFPNAANNQVIGGVGGPWTSIGYTPASQITGISRSNDAYAWTGAYNVTRAYTANGLNQLINSGGTTIGYDGRGNLTSSGTTSYTYNVFNQYTGGTGATIDYDDAGRLLKYTTSSGSTQFSYAGSALTVETSGGVITQRYVPGPGTDEPIVWYVGNSTANRNFLTADERGSIIAVSNSAGTVTNINSYDEFGIPAATNVGRFQYTGQTWFPEVGLYYYKARWYSPTLGRFMQTDPIGYGDGMNWYNYAHGDPINGSDPSGTDLWSMTCNGNCKSIPGGAYNYGPPNNSSDPTSFANADGTISTPDQIKAALNYYGYYLDAAGNKISYSVDAWQAAINGELQSLLNLTPRGFGYWVGGSLEAGAGLGYPGAGGQFQYSTVSFGGNSVGNYLTTGTTAALSQKSNGVIAGASVGLGGGVVITNATQPNALSGSAMSYNLNVLVFSGSLSVSGGTYSLNLGLAKGLGLDGSAYQTFTTCYLTGMRSC